MRTELEIKDLLKERIENLKHFSKLVRHERVNKTFNKHMTSTYYGSIIALLEIIDDKSLTEKTIADIKEEIKV